MIFLADYFRFALSLIAILAPLTAVPVFISLTRDYSSAEKTKTSVTAAFTIFIVLGIAAVAGERILTLFGTTINSFRIAGGILLIYIAFGLLRAKIGAHRQTREEEAEAETRTTVGAVPIAIPLMAGPGSITLTIIQAQTSFTVWNFTVVFAGIVTASLISLGVLVLSERIAKLLGTTGINICNRIMGLMVASIAVELIVTGIVNVAKLNFS